uniref:Uncharacterized protein n=1 Tax=Avena sativa TaxID=4498 RepID=A0ACD5YII3_AVESA
MGKKGALTSVFSRSRSRSGVDSPPWPWPSCGELQTDSFRAGGEPCASAAASGSRCGPVSARHRKLVGADCGEMYKTVNSVYFDPDGGESCSGTNADEEWVVVEDDGFSTATACAEEEWSEAVIRSLSRTTSSTHRFFFDKGRPATNSIVPAAAAPASSPAGRTSTPSEAEAALSEKEKQPGGPGDGGRSLVAEESVAVAVESSDPYHDFLASMEEMVAAHGLQGWDALEELLVWYLRVNAKRHHPLIVSAFVDLLLGLTGTPSATSTTTTTVTTTSSSSTSTSSSASIGSSKSTSTSTTTASTGDDVIAAVAATTEQCGGGKKAHASCSSSSSTRVPSGLGEAGRGEE